MATNLILPPTPAAAYALLSTATSSYDVNMLELRHGFPSEDADTATHNSTRISPTSAAASVGVWSPGINGTAADPLSRTQSVLVSMILGVIIVITVTGNFLVVASIVVNAHLRTTTNYFIANLAIADLLLGTTVLPFSASLEVLQYWAFGQIFCDVWAAIDVLCCTASILSLCVISIDRYIGVTRPLQHPNIVGHKRAFYVIFGVWVLSGIISVAPLIGWKEEPDPNPLVCTVTQHTGYVLFSTALSFYIPCLILLLVYYRIYRKTVAYTKCILAGGKLAKVDEENKVVLRIHTGNHRASTTSTTMTTTTNTTASNSRTTLKLQKSYSNTSKNSNGISHASLKRGHSNGSGRGKRAITADMEKGDNREFSSRPSNAFDESEKDGRGRKKSPGSGGSRITFSSRVAKFKREKKAAKTLGIVVGVFITCWLPFFFILPLQSLCARCEIPPLMFKLIFWLGYCNSTMNPIIYTCSSTEFRRAFQSILFCRKCRKRRQTPAITTKVKLKISTTSQKRSNSNPKTKRNSSKTLCNANSFEFGNISSGSSTFASRSIGSTPCFHRQVYEMSGYENTNGKDTSSQCHQKHGHTEFMCTSCSRNIRKNGTHCDSLSQHCNHSSQMMDAFHEEDDSSSHLQHPHHHNHHNHNHHRHPTSNQNSQHTQCVPCCNDVLEDSDLSLTYKQDYFHRDKLPSSCEISMASLSCHSSSPTMSSSGH